MKVSLPFSILMHGVLLALLIASAPEPKLWRQRPSVVQVELVSLPPAEVITEPVVVKPASVKTIPEPEKDRPKTETPPEKLKTVKKKTTSTVNTTIKNGDNIKVNTENFPFAYYLTLLQSRIQENWRPPFQGGGLNDTLSAVVAFKINRKGAFDSIDLENSSGRFLFDQAAQRAIYNISRMPPLPPEYSGADLSVHIEFESIQ